MNYKLSNLIFDNMDDFEWNVYSETKLFEAMIDHKPVGVNKHFQMALICNKLQDFFDISAEKVWAHLDTMYNMESLDEMDSLPFPNDEQEFYLPDIEFANLKTKKEEEKKTIALKKNENKETGNKQVNKEVKKEEKPVKGVVEKKELVEKQNNVSSANQRRDSRDGKDVKTPVAASKKDARKSKTPSTSSSSKEEEKVKTKTEDRLPLRTNKRPTRGSTRPEEVSSSGPGLRKSQSPLTVTPGTANKRRRI